MTDHKGTWSEISDRLEALGLKLKLHGEQTGGTDVADAFTQLGHSVRQAFEAAGNAVKDDAVREDVRQLGRLVADAVSTAVSKAADDVRDATKRG